MCAETGAVSGLAGVQCFGSAASGGNSCPACADLICSDPHSDACAAGSIIVAFRPSQLQRFLRSRRAAIQVAPAGATARRARSQFAPSLKAWSATVAIDTASRKLWVAPAYSFATTSTPALRRRAASATLCSASTSHCALSRHAGGSPSRRARNGAASGSSASAGVAR